MASRSHGTVQVRGGVVTGERETSGGPEYLEGFLAASRVRVLDVTRGTAVGTRRLLLGESGAGAASYAVAVADRPSAAPAIATEIRTLNELHAMIAPPVLTTLPRVVASVSVGDRPAVVLTAVPGLPSDYQRRDRQAPALRADLEAVCSWLGDLWRCTGRLSEPVELGKYAADLLLARYCGSRRLAPTLGAVHRARHRLGHLDVVRTAVHGCLCPRHAHVRDGAVIGVDDWGVASTSGEPLRDLGGFAVRHAGARLPEVLADRTGHAHLLRDFVVAGLVAVGLPGSRWRDVLILAQLEKAVTALECGQLNDIGLLAAAVNALPRESEEPEATRQ